MIGRPVSSFRPLAQVTRAKGWPEMNLPVTRSIT